MKTGIIIFVTALTLLINLKAFANESKILFVSAAHSNKAKVTLIKKLAKEQGLHIGHQSIRDLDDLDKALSVFNTYDVVMFDAVSIKATQGSFGKYASLIKTSTARFVPIKAPQNKQLRKGVSEAQAEKLFAYYDNGGVENFKRLLQFIQHRVIIKDSNIIADPVIYPQAGIYHPDYETRIFDSLAAYKAWQTTMRKTSAASGTESNVAPSIALLMPRALIESAETQPIDDTIELLEKKGIDVFPVFYESSATPDDYLTLLQVDGQTVVDTLINFRVIHFANQRKIEFETLGRPVIQAMTYYGGHQKTWEDSAQGISPGMMAFTLVLPETSGVIDPIIISARDKDSGETRIIDYQLDYLIDRALNYARLVNTPNAEKKLTVMFWGDKDMGASFLNVPDSLHTISHRLHNEGYKVEPHEHDYYSDRASRILDPFYRAYELDKLLADNLAALLPMTDYRDWLNTLPAPVVQAVTDFWGEPEENFMVVERDGQHYFVIPRIQNGNILVMRQPPRGDSKDQDQTLYHTTAIPMNHYYLAAYFYAREIWKSNAFIHLGTHGSQEYLPGKERGLSRYDGGSLAIGTVPVMYPFIVDDVGEAMQVKRRGGAVAVSHMTPPFAAAGLQGVTADIHELMHQYNALDEGGVKEKTGAQIIALCIEENLCDDFGWNAQKITDDFAGFLVALHDYMGELAAENQPLGLHSFGELAEKNLLISTLVQMLGSDFIAETSLFESDYYRAGHSHDEGGEHSHNADSTHHHDDKQTDDGQNNTNHTQQHAGDFHETSSDLESLAGFKTVRDFVVGDTDPAALKESVLNKTLHTFIEHGKTLYRNMGDIQELDNLVAGLAGQYIPVNTGGDPIRHPDSLPTGLNLYGFDPARLPTKAAYAQGIELVEDMIANYYQDNGRYPSKMAFSLWSIEAMRHYGVLESQAMRAMGVKPVWSPDGRVVDIEIIPAAELKRPRIDIVLSATGLYRDAFPAVMQRLAKAIQQVAQLKEDNNSLWDNSQRIKADLIADGVTEEEAEYLSTVRIFSNTSGQYGSGVDGPVFNSDTWETDAKIADNYLAKMGYYFGADDSRWGKKSAGLYGKQLSGTDIVAFSRSSNLYGMITSDDPFEYFGSLALAIRNLDGKSPEMMISNLRDAKNGKMEKASTFLAKELRTRNFNERWIKEMQKEGYSGAVVMASSIANFWGWQVVDPNIVRADQWQEFFEVYVEDKLELGINEWFEKVNPAAQAQLLERMLEAVRKGYWDADAATLEAMLERYQSLVSQHDLLVDNEKLREYVNQQAAGFGLDVQLPAPPPAGAIESQPAQENIEGQKLEKVESSKTDSELDKSLLYTLLALALAVIAGAWRQANRQYQ
ncbi:hypothetical protein A9Q88_02750 [Gammaproteobacteria bacterium 50_400_T64]|nr:hypothetical protein A9Q88_02750 [Gammaproteobacteria bacterium 50_400_T64]